MEPAALKMVVVDVIGLVPEAPPVQLTPSPDPKPVPFSEKVDPDTLIETLPWPDEKLPLPPVAGSVTDPENTPPYPITL